MTSLPSINFGWDKPKEIQDYVDEVGTWNLANYDQIEILLDWQKVTYKFPKICVIIGIVGLVIFGVIALLATQTRFFGAPYQGGNHFYSRAEGAFLISGLVGLFGAGAVALGTAMGIVTYRMQKKIKDDQTKPDHPYLDELLRIKHSRIRVAQTPLQQKPVYDEFDETNLR